MKNGTRLRTNKNIADFRAKQELRVTHELSGVERRTVCGVIVHETLQRGLVGALHHERHDFPRGAIPDASNGGFAHGTTASLELLLG